MAKNEKSAAAEKIAAAEKVKAKKPKSDKPNIFVRAWKAIVRFFKDLRGETKKIVWPDGKTVLKSTGVVLAVVAVFTVIIWLIDLGLSRSIELLSDAARSADETVTEIAEDSENTVSEEIQIEESVSEENQIEEAATEAPTEIILEAPSAEATEAASAAE